MKNSRKNIEFDPLFANDLKKLKLNKKQLQKITRDIKEINEGAKKPKQLYKTMFPLKELKYLSWGIRIILIETPNAFIFLSANRKKDWETKAYQDAKNDIKNS